MASRCVTWREIYERLAEAPRGRLYGIPRGGSIIAGLTGRAVDTVESADWLVDDVIDSGSTAGDWTARSGKPIWALFDRKRDGLTDRQLVMPWEHPDDDTDQHTRLERIGRELVEALGYDAAADGLRDTPERWARWWQEFLTPRISSRLDSTFEVAEAGRIVLITGMRVWSICEHHLLPFSVDVSIGYVPRTRVLGLSKFARLSLHAARRLQLQERLTSQIADATCHLTGSPDLAVLVSGRHLCMEARGVRMPALVTSLVTRGAFDDDPSLRADFVALLDISSRRKSRAPDTD